MSASQLQKVMDDKFANNAAAHAKHQEKQAQIFQKNKLSRFGSDQRSDLQDRHHRNLNSIKLKRQSQLEDIAMANQRSQTMVKNQLEWKNKFDNINEQ